MTTRTYSDQSCGSPDYTYISVAASACLPLGKGYDARVNCSSSFGTGSDLWSLYPAGSNCTGEAAYAADLSQESTCFATDDTPAGTGTGTGGASAASAGGIAWPAAVPVDDGATAGPLHRTGRSQSRPTRRLRSGTGGGAGGSTKALEDSSSTAPTAEPTAAPSGGSLDGGGGSSSSNSEEDDNNHHSSGTNSTGTASGSFEGSGGSEEFDDVDEESNESGSEEEEDDNNTDGGDNNPLPPGLFFPPPSVSSTPYPPDPAAHKKSLQYFCVGASPSAPPTVAPTKMPATAFPTTTLAKEVKFSVKQVIATCAATIIYIA
jgi:hypothetical protein